VREERGQIAGDVIVYEPFTLWGSIGGDVKVIERGKLYVRGAVYGNIVVEYGGRMHIFGRVTGTLTVHRGAKVIHSGVLGGDLVNLGGRVYIDHVSKIMGKVKTEKGETMVQTAPRVPRNK
jgi:cytoskeletal protein CcmA (bactofilin family)